MFCILIRSMDVVVCCGRGVIVLLLLILSFICWLFVVILSLIWCVMVWWLVWGIICGLVICIILGLSRMG